MTTDKITAIIALSATLSRVQGVSRSLAGVPPCLGARSERAAALLENAKTNLNALAETVGALLVREVDGAVDEIDARRALGELLAVIHGDGGHHEETVGTTQAVEDARQLIATLRSELDDVKSGALAALMSRDDDDIPFK